MFTLPKWMTNLRAKEPEGTRTPDQVASSLELSLLIHNDVGMLKDLIAELVPQVPLKRQPVIRALLTGDVLANVQVFIDKSNIALAQLQPQEAPKHDEPEPPAISGQSPTDHDAHPVSDWREVHDSPLQGKRRTRGYRAVRDAKRQTLES